MPIARPYTNLPDHDHKGGKAGPIWGTPHLAHLRSGENESISQTLEKQRKDDFLSMASHELKTPISTLKAFLQMVSDNDGPEAVVSKVHLKKMVDQVDRLTRLVTDLLEVSKIQKGEIEFEKDNVDVDILVNEVLADARSRHTSHQFMLSGTAGCKITGDRARLGQAITELLNNAVKFSPNSDRIEVNVACKENAVEITVQDHGIGLHSADQDKIFERYFRVLKDPAKPFPGLGVGLYIVSEIVRHHQGRILVTSEAGEGAAFTLSLPVQPAEADG